MLGYSGKTITEGLGATKMVMVDSDENNLQLLEQLLQMKLWEVFQMEEDWFLQKEEGCPPLVAREAWRNLCGGQCGQGKHSIRVTGGN